MIHLLKAASNTDLFLFVSKTGKETFGCPADRSAVGENHQSHAAESFAVAYPQTPESGSNPDKGVRQS